MSTDSAEPVELLPPHTWDAAARTALDALPVIAFAARDSGAIAWISRRWYEITGRSPGDDLTTILLDVIAPEDQDRAMAAWAAARETGERYELTVRARMRDGSYRWYLTSAERLLAPNDMYAAWFGTAIEVTERRRAELAIAASEAQYRVLAEAMPQIAWSSLGKRNDYLNAQWYRYTGIDPSGPQPDWSEALHPEDVEPTFARWRQSFATNEPFEIEYRLRRADGQYRWFLGRGAPYVDADGVVRRWFGTCTDIDDLRRRERAERFISDAVARLARSRDVTESCALVAACAVESIATYCVVDLIRDNGRLERVAWSHTNADRAIELGEIVNYPPTFDRPESPVARALGRERATFAPHFDDAWLRRTAINDDHYRFMQRLAPSSLIAVPLEAYGRDIGAISFCLADTDDTFDEVDLAAFRDVGRRLGAAIENASVSQHDRTIALRFQRAALPRTLPSVPGVTFDAVYHAAAGDAEVGGDWYDAVVTSDGRIAFSLGDVAGHDLDAAIGMIGVRQAIRTAAFFGHAPHDMLETVNAAMAGEAVGRYATAFVATLDVASGDLRFAAAGHPPVFLRRANGRIETLASEAPPLGLFAGGESFVDQRVTLEAGDVLVLYTDGLIEGDRDPISGESTLRATVASNAFAHAPSPAIHLRDRMLRVPARDDVAILVVGFSPPDRWTFEALDSSGAQGARVSFSRYIERSCTATSDLVACELIFGELIGNVVRHAPGPVQIVVAWEDGRAMLHVYDSGPGLSWRGPSLPDDYAEGGRGLYIVTQLARRIFVEPKAGRGTHIAIELPVERRAFQGVSP
ncbi:MAG: hypothetical protein NVS2B8_06450 [Vulcanimicrobiaceae bacterium]